MKIWHVGASPSPKAVNGVNFSVWAIAKEQALLGHEVTLLVEGHAETFHTKIQPVSLNEKSKVRIHSIGGNTWKYNSHHVKAALEFSRPDVVHFHSVFLPKQADLANCMVKEGIPYVVSPHGGLYSQRGKLKKHIYNFLIERRRFELASAIVVVAPKEEDVVRSLVPGYKGNICWIPNPIDIDSLREYTWEERDYRTKNSLLRPF